MSEDPSFSVVLPVYNRAATLDRTLASVAAQTLAPVETLVVDDGSTDGSAEVAMRWRERLAGLVLIRQENAGVAAARNRAMEGASGSWLAFIDSDDEWKPDKLEAYARLIRNQPETDMVHSDRYAADGTTRAVRNADAGADRYEDPLYLLSFWVLLTTTIAVRRVTAAKAGRFIENLYSCSDYEWFWRVVCCCRRVGYVPEPMAVMHDGPLGMARKLNEQNRIRDNLRAMASALAWMDRNGVASEYHAALARWRIREFKHLVTANLEQKRYLAAGTELGRLIMESLTRRYLYVPVSRKLK